MHILFFANSFVGVLSKLAVQQEFLSFKFILYCGLIFFILGLYALLWQQILKVMPLTVAYPNKAVAIIWGMFFGVMIFKEVITITNIIGGVIVLVGVCLVVREDA